MIRNTLAKAFYGIGNIVAGGYDGGESNRIRKDLGWGRNTAKDEDNLVGDTTRQNLRQKGMDLRRNNPVVAGVCDRIALFTVGAKGILPQCRTKDKGWNKAAEEWWNFEYAPSCDSRKRCSLVDFQWQAVSLRPTHGGLYFQKLSDGKIRPIECERIRNPQDPETSKKYTEGVHVSTATGEIINYSVHSRDKNGTFNEEHPEQNVLRDNIIPVIRPPWRPDQIREICDLSPVIPALQDIGEMNTYTLATAKWQSKILAFLKKAGGGGLNLQPRGTTPVVGSRQTFKYDWGEILEGFPGDDLEMKNSTTPNATHIPYVKLQYAICAAALGFPYEFLTLDLSGLDFSRQKGMLLLVNYACRPWKQWLAQKFLNELWCWRIAMEMGPAGQLSPAPSINGLSQWSKVAWQFPEELWIDRQEQSQADILEWQAGQGTMSQFAARRGDDLEELLRRKAEDIELAREIEDEYNLPEGVLINTQIPGQADPAKTTSPDSTEPMKKGMSPKDMNNE